MISELKHVTLPEIHSNQLPRATLSNEIMKVYRLAENNIAEWALLEQLLWFLF